VDREQGDQIELLLSLGSLGNNTEEAQTFWSTFFSQKSYEMIVTKMGWAKL
jgi:hypothetical protein